MLFVKKPNTQFQRQPIRCPISLPKAELSTGVCARVCVDR